MESCLIDRKQYVQVGQEASSMKKSMCDVPQLLVLKPLLFQFYVNNLPNFVESRRPCSLMIPYFMIKCLHLIFFRSIELSKNSIIG